MHVKYLEEVLIVKTSFLVLQKKSLREFAF